MKKLLKVSMLSIMMFLVVFSCFVSTSLAESTGCCDPDSTKVYWINKTTVNLCWCYDSVVNSAATGFKIYSSATEAGTFKEIGKTTDPKARKITVTLPITSGSNVLAATAFSPTEESPKSEKITVNVKMTKPSKATNVRMK